MHNIQLNNINYYAKLWNFSLKLIILVKNSLMIHGPKIFSTYTLIRKQRNQ